VQVLNVKEESPISLVEILEKLGLRLFIGTRMHSVILASLNGVPAVTVSYQHFKGHGIPEQLGLSDYIINIEELQPEILISHVDKLLKNYEEVRRNVLVQVNRIRSQGTPKVRSLLLQHVKS